jgi:protein-tyrosine phosphatase
VWQNGPQFGTPLYYGPHLERFPERSAAVMRAIARARPGGVVFHCAGGRDRSGQIAMLVLALAGVPTADIVADYGLSDEGVSARCAARGEPDQVPMIAAYLAEQDTSAGAIIERTLAGVDAEALAGPDAAALRARLLEP